MDGIRWWRIGAPEAGALEHRGRRLVADEGPGDVGEAAIVGTSLWMEGNGGENELSFQRTLLLEDNLPFLMELAGIGPELKPVLVAREIGGAGSIDLGALFRARDDEQKQLLVLVDCKDARARAHKKLTEQCAQAYRLAQAAFSSLMLDPPLRPADIRLVLVSGLGWGQELPEQLETMPLPGWCIDGRFTTIPKPLVHVYLPVRVKNREEHWLAIQELRRSAGPNDLWRATWSKAARRMNDKAPIHEKVASAFHHVAVSASLHVDALAGRRPEGSEAAAIRKLLREGRGGTSGASGWRYAGETNDKGFVRLWWEQTNGGGLDELRAYLRSAGLDPDRIDGAAAPPPPGSAGARR